MQTPHLTPRRASSSLRAALLLTRLRVRRRLRPAAARARPVDEDNTFEVTAEFADVLNVVPRSVVMVDDVTVGEVIEVERVGWHADGHDAGPRRHELPDNAIADIRQTSLLGEKYVALEAPVDGGRRSASSSDGDDIPLSATGRNPEVEEVLGALSFLLSGGGVGQLGTITEELNNVMSGRTDRLRHLLGSLENVIGTLDAQKAEIICGDGVDERAREDPQRREGDDRRGARRDGPGGRRAGRAARGADRDARRARPARRGRHPRDRRQQGRPDRRPCANLRPVLPGCGDAGDQLATGLDMMVSFPFPKEAANVVKGDYANASIRAGDQPRTSASRRRRRRQPDPADPRSRTPARSSPPSRSASRAATSPARPAGRC